MPFGYCLDACDPDPFSSSTTVAYGLPRISDVTLEVCGDRGERVRLLVDGTQDAGEYAVQWDGASDGGMPSPMEPTDSD